MSYIRILKRQHEDIYNLISEIKDSIKTKDNLENRAFEISQKINLLAGKLKIHFGTEDQYLYPYILEEGSDELKKLAEEYTAEMGDISVKFSDYKTHFNTKSKIISNLEGFLLETEKILKAIEERIKKEDSNLYQDLNI